MATKTFYLKSGISSNVQQEMSETAPGANATISPNYGWTVGTTAAGNFSAADAQTERLSSTFGAEPGSGLVTTAGAGNAWRTPVPLTGSFAAGTWQIDGAVIAVSFAGGQDGRIKTRIFRSTDPTGAGATELTSSAATGSTVTDLLTSAQQTSTTTVSLGAITVTDEFLFFQVYWEITGTTSGHSAGLSDVNFRTGTTASLVTTPDFTQASGQTAYLQYGTFATASDAGGEIDWSVPANAQTPDGPNTAYNSTATAINEHSYSLKCTNPNPGITAGSTIDKIKVYFDRYASIASSITDYSIMLIVGGSYSGNEKAAGAFWPTSMTTTSFTWETATDTMPSDTSVNASDFGVRLKVQNEVGSSEVARLDHVYVTIYYTPPVATARLRTLVGVGT